MSSVGSEAGNWRNIPSSLYFGLASLYCFYELALGGDAISAMVVAPVFFMLICLAIFLVPAAFYIFFSGFAVGMFKNPFEGQERLNGGFANLAFAGIALFLAWTFYQSIPLEQRGLLSDPLSLAILVISLIVTIQAGISKALEDKGSDMSFLRRFARHAVMTGIGPGAMAVCCLIGSYVAYILIAVGTPGQLLRFFACFLIGAWFVAKLGRIPILKDGKFNAPQLAFAIAIAAALFLLSGAFSGFLTESKLQLFLFALTYAFFSKLEFDGTIERLGSTETGLGALRWL